MNEAPSRVGQCWLTALAVLSGTALVGWVVYDAAGPNFFGQRPWPDSVVDYHILYEQSRQVLRDGAYDPATVFPYPPSAVVLLAATALPPFPLAAAIWLAATIGATLVAVVLGADLVGLRNRLWRWPATLLAFVLAGYYIEWDLRSQNCNMIYCALLAGSLASLRRSRDDTAGVLLAASIALKLYSVLLVPYFWWVGRRRAFGAALGGLALFFAVMPLFAFGPRGFFGVYASYAAHLTGILGSAHAAWHPISIALPLTLTRQLGPGSPAAPVLLRMASLAWFAAAAGCLVLGRPRRARPCHGWDLAADGGVLALLPTVVSPYLEPYHAVPALLLTLALVARAAAADAHPAVRRLAAGGLAVGCIALREGGALGWRGVGVWAEMVAFALALAAVRHLAGKPASALRSAEPGRPLRRAA